VLLVLVCTALALLPLAEVAVAPYPPAEVE
jgi:hypothetical protein